MFDLRHLPGADLQETQVFVLRAHPITLLPLLITAVMLFLIPPGLYVGLRFLTPELFDEPTYVALLMLGVSAFFLVGWLFVFQAFVDHWLDILVVTDKRILDIEQKGLFSRTVSETRLHRTQDVTAQVTGFWHSLFDYGDVFLQTAGEEKRFHFQNVPHPNHVAKILLEFAEEARKEQLENAVEEFGMPEHQTKKD